MVAPQRLATFVTGQSLLLVHGRKNRGWKIASQSHRPIPQPSYRIDYALSLIGPLVAVFGCVLVEFLRPARTVRVWYRLWSWTLPSFDPVEDRCEDLGVQKVTKQNAMSLVKYTLVISRQSQEVGGTRSRFL